MVDIAALSVVSSGLVAVGSIATTLITSERQRQHETDLDFERRVWEKKSDALFAVIEVCEDLVDAPDPKDEKDSWLAFGLSRLLDTLTSNRAAVGAFASSKCRDELTSLIKALKDGGARTGIGRRWDQTWDRLVQVDIESDYPEWKVLWEQRKKAEEDALTGFDPDMARLRAQAGRLLDAARDSVRRPKN